MAYILINETKLVVGFAWASRELFQYGRNMEGLEGFYQVKKDKSSARECHPVPQILAGFLRATTTLRYFSSMLHDQL